MSTAEALNQIRNLEVLNSGFSLVGRQVKLGDFKGVVSQYKPLEDAFDIQFEVNGPAFPVSRATLESIILPSAPRQQSANDIAIKGQAPPPPPPPPQGMPPPPPPPPHSMFNTSPTSATTTAGINNLGASNIDLSQQIQLLKQQQQQTMQNANMNPFLFSNPSPNMSANLMQNPFNLLNTSSLVHSQQHDNGFGSSASSSPADTPPRTFRRTNSLPNLNLAALNQPQSQSIQPPASSLVPPSLASSSLASSSLTSPSLASLSSPTNNFHQPSSLLGQMNQKQKQQRRHSALLQQRYNSGHVSGGTLLGGINSFLNANRGSLDVLEEEEKHGMFYNLQTPTSITKTSMLHSTGQPQAPDKLSMMGFNSLDIPSSAKAGTASRTLADSTTTKTGVFKIMHSCYRCMSGMSGRQDAYYGANMIPVYSFIEKSLQTPSNINAARLSALRSRFLMKRTLSQVKDLLPCPPEKYIVNSITTACPICGRAIALNKLASHENWCKHLECSHGEIGASIAARFRALDKNFADQVPELKLEVEKPEADISKKDKYSWVDVEKRADMAPVDCSIFDTPSCLVPFTSRFHWHAIMFDQLLSETALQPNSVLTQELVTTGLLHYGIDLDAPHRFRRLVDFQENMMRSSRVAFSVYSNKHHPDLVSNPKSKEIESMNIHVNVSAQRVMSDLMNVNPNKSSSKLPSLFNAVRSCYKDNTVKYFSEIELEVAKIDGARSVNALRLVILRRRQLMMKTLKDVIDKITHSSDPSDMFPKEDELVINPAAYVVNILYTTCPLCKEMVYSESDSLHDDSWCRHLETNHGDYGQAIAVRYRALERNLEEAEIPKIVNSVGSLKLQVPFTESERIDMAPLREEPTNENKLIPMMNKIDWRALMFDDMLTNNVLTSESVLTQEIVVMGLFYFGLVNQRSPQKFGQYPQLQGFQKLVHETSSSAYDVYCGVGIKEGELGSSHTRGRPVHATTAVIRKYHHYGLSHKSLQRNDRRSDKKSRRKSEIFTSSKGSLTLKRKNSVTKGLPRRRRSSVEPVFLNAPGQGLIFQPVSYVPIKENM
mmetsp:Transcript_20558/g.26229  ORF Transcript_20558/g.26229 Transcript_20558/m.26229 type:complete len:1055 (+) Transcript_20558:58-3222(+)